MLKNLSAKKRCFVFGILMSLVIALGFGAKSILADQTPGGESPADLSLWTLTLDPNDNTIGTLGLSEEETDVTNLVVPNAQDYINSEAESADKQYTNLAKLYITKETMYLALLKVNEDGGTFKISDTGEGNKQKVFAKGNDWSCMSNPDGDEDGFLDEISKINLTHFDTSGVTNMNSMFACCDNLEELILGNDFKTNDVEDMSLMFAGCGSLEELDLSCFNTSKVTKMSGMFIGCESLKEINWGDNWDTSSVTNMGLIFGDCCAIEDLPLGNWDTSSLENMNYMFYNCKSLIEPDVANWDTSHVTSMNGLFIGCENMEAVDVSNWDVKNVKSMDSLFSGCTSLLGIDVSEWETSSLTEMGAMFYNCKRLSEIDISNFDTGNVSDMSGLFNGCKNASEINVSGIDTHNVTDMDSIFADCERVKILDISSFDTGNVENMRGMFAGLQNIEELKGIEKLDVSNVTSMDGIFSGATDDLLENLDLSDWDLNAMKENGISLQDVAGDHASSVFSIGGSGNSDNNSKNNGNRNNDKDAGNTSNNENTVSENNNFSWNTSSDSEASSSYNVAHSQNTPMSSLTSVLSQQIPAKLQTRLYLKGYEDGTIKPDKGVTNAELATVLTNLVKENDEIIVQSPVWYEGSISYVLKKGIMKAEDCAKPNAFATVGQINSALDNVLRVCGANSSVANSLGASAIYGTTNTNVSLSENSQTVTRGQLANMIRNKFGRSKKQVTVKTFSDLSPNHPYYEAIMDAVQ